MPDTSFDILHKIIAGRRTVKPSLMNGRPIPDEEVKKLLELANWAPMHGRTEPWRFFVFTGEALKQFGQTHAQMYWEHTPEEQRDPKKYEKQLHNVDQASHLVIVAMKRGRNPLIPAEEEMASAAAAVQNMLLGATALGIAAFWSTGGMTHKQAMKDYLGLEEEDHVIALLYLGYTDEVIKDVPRKPIEEKVKWME